MQLTFDHMLHSHHWRHDIVHLEHEDGRMLLRIYGVRLEALVIASCLWVMLTLTTGIFTVAMVILIGAAVGNAHHLLGSMPRRAHHSSAIVLTLCGGLVANVLAGLALFGSRTGVSYWQVLTSRRIPEDLPMLIDMFAESFRPEDGLFYALAVAVAMLSARHLRPWRKRRPKITRDHHSNREMNYW